MAYKQPSSGPFKMMGSSPAKQTLEEMGLKIPDYSKITNTKKGEKPGDPPKGTKSTKGAQSLITKGLKGVRTLLPKKGEKSGDPRPKSGDPIPVTADPNYKGDPELLREEEEKKKKSTGYTRAVGWYDDDGKWHHGMRPKGNK